MSYPTDHWDHPDRACVPCRGRGWIIQEDATGMPGSQVPCPYCHGRQTTWWVAHNRTKRFQRFTKRRVLILGLALGLLMTGNLWPALDEYTSFSSYMFVLHLALWLALLVAWVKSPPRRKVDPSRIKHRQGPGFNTDREGKFLAGFGAAVGLRSLWDSSHKRGF
jgi:hypothetical protein